MNTLTAVFGITLLAAAWPLLEEILQRIGSMTG